MIKKMLLLPIIFCASILYSKNCVVVNAQTSTYEYGVGFSMDVTGETFAGNNYIVSSPIYKDEFLNSSPYNIIYKAQSLYAENSGKSLYQYAINYQNQYKIDLGLGTDLPYFSTDMLGFSKNSFVANSFCTQFYYKRSYEAHKYTVYLKNQLDLSKNENYLTDSFLADLQKLVNKTMDYESFFHRYGTHLITSAKYGGTYASYFTFSSEEMQLTDEITESLISSSRATLSSYGYGGIDAKLEASTNEIIKNYYNDNKINCSFYIETYGGNTFTAINENYDDAYLSWIDSVDSDEYDPVIIGYEENSLVPLSDILPSSYQSIKAEMENQLKEYIKNRFVEKEVQISSDSIVLETNLIRVDETSKDIVEKKESKILENPYDVVYFNNLASNPYDYYSYGYTQLAFIVTLDVSEKYDGRQYICIYPNDTTMASPLKKTVFDHTPNKRDSYWATHVVKVDSINMNTFTSKQSFIIGYNASGYMDDNWINRNVKINLVVSKLAISY